MKVLKEDDGAASGVTIWTIAGWGAVILCLLILICAVAYFKKSIE
jgi:Na+-transporting methylmalonyl-CoA/oxaloacetate decarboxylase gamma subunit